MTPESYFELLALPREFEQRSAEPDQPFYVARSPDGTTLVTNLPVSVIAEPQASYSEVLLLLAATYTLGVPVARMVELDRVLVLKAADLFAAEFLPPLALAGAIALIPPGDFLKWLMSGGAWWWQLCQADSVLSD